MRILRVLALLCSLVVCVFGQSAGENPNIDPLALQVLRATADSLKNARSFSFRAVISREGLGSNDQVVTFFRQSEVTVSRPDKVRIHTTGEHQPLDLYFNRGALVLYAPDKKLYARVDVHPTLDLAVDRIEKQNIQLPMSPFLRADPYQMLTDGLTGAAVIGRVEIAGKTFHHLLFSEKDAEWQLWVEAGAKPTPRRAQIVYKRLAREPRVTIDFLEWNLSANPPPDLFVFQKPADAKAIQFLEANGGK
jgi:hypothetical protein